jgi:hypothetical protein
VYPAQSDDLSCTYVNPGHGDQPGLVLPGKPGTQYTVEVSGVPDGWTVDTGTIGAFLADDTCPKSGGHDDGHGEDAVLTAEEDGEEGEHEPCVHTVVIQGPTADDEGNGPVNPPADENAAPPVVQAAAGAALPHTGASIAVLLLLAVVLLAFGTTLAVTTRRPDVPHSANGRHR